MALTKASYSMITGAMANVLDYGATGNGVSDDTAAFVAAAATGNPIWMPPGNYVITSPVTISANLYGAGAGDANSSAPTKIILANTGQLIVGKWYCQWDGFEVRSSVNNKVFIVNPGQSYWTFTNFVLNKTFGSGATAQTGIQFEMYGSSIYFNRIDNFVFRLDYPVKVRGDNTQAFNANKLGMGVGGNKWFDFIDAIGISSNAFVFDANEIGGYFELGSNIIVSDITRLRQNRFRLVVDAVSQVYNSAFALVDENLWEILDGGLTYSGINPQNQIVIGAETTKIRATDAGSTPVIPNATAIVMTFDTEQFDTLSEFAPGNGKFTPRQNGYYQIDAEAATQGYSWVGGTRFEIRIRKNGIDYASSIFTMAVSTSPNLIPMTASISSLVYLQGNVDDLEIIVIHNQGGPIYLSTDPLQNFINISRVS